jgi:hypothetical protein
MKEQLRELLQGDPFVPFRITLTSGQAFDVSYPGLVAEGSTQRIYCFPKSDRYAILRLNQLASAETLDGLGGRRGDGARRGRR